MRRAQSIFSRLAGMVSGGVDAVGQVVSDARGVLRALADCSNRRDVAFAIAMIALSAKMAKADGVVTRSEVDAFCQIFSIPQGEEKNVSRVYNLAKRDIAGFESYAAEIQRLFADDPAMLEDVLDGLFHIAKADGALTEHELGYLSRIATIFGHTERDFERQRARHVNGGTDDPYLVLDADPAWDAARLKRHYRSLVAANHPDRVIARGLPAEFVRIANERLAVINAAWDRIEGSRSPA